MVTMDLTAHTACNHSPRKQKSRPTHDIKKQREQHGSSSRDEHRDPGTCKPLCGWCFSHRGAPNPCAASLLLFLPLVFVWLCCSFSVCVKGGLVLDFTPIAHRLDDWAMLTPVSSPCWLMATFHLCLEEGFAQSWLLCRRRLLAYQRRESTLPRRRGAADQRLGSGEPLRTALICADKRWTLCLLLLTPSGAGMSEKKTPTSLRCLSDSATFSNTCVLLDTKFCGLVCRQRLFWRCSCRILSDIFCPVSLVARCCSSVFASSSSHIFAVSLLASAFCELHTFRITLDCVHFVFFRTWT